MHKINIKRHHYSYKIITRMHSSRMRTGQSLTICRGGVSCHGGASPCQRVSLPGGLLARGPPCRGYLPARGVSLLGGTPCQGGSPWKGGSPCRGHPSQGGLPGRGASLPEGGLPARGVLPAWGGLPAGDPLPVDRITDTSKNITGR